MFDDTDHQLKDACRDLAENQAEHDQIEWWCSELNDAIDSLNTQKEINNRRNLLEFQRRRLTRK